MTNRAPRGYPRLVDLICKRCGRAYKVRPYRALKSRFCSFACTKIAKHCDRCGVPIIRRPGRRRFCSRACAVAYMVGPRASVWKGGISKRKARGRLGRLLTEWSQAVLKRDRYTCQQCGAAGSGIYLHAHHIKPFATHPRLRTKIDNGLTLCEPCHCAIHGKVLRGRNRGSKICQDCGSACSGRGNRRCRSCALRRSWAGGLMRATAPT